MKTAGFFLRVSLCALLIVDSSGMYLKGSKSHQQSSGGSGTNVPSYQGASTGRPAPELYSSPRFVSAPVFVQDPSLSQTGPVVSSVGSAAPAVGYSAGSGSAMPLHPGAVGSAGSGSAMPLHPGAVGSGSVPLQAGYVGSGSVPLQAGYVGSGSVPLQAGYVVPLQAGPVGSGPARSSPPETQWAVPPRSFTEASADAQNQDLGHLLPSGPLAAPGPVLQSGETSSVVKEAELGNYQHQTEEFGYPDERLGPVQGFPGVVMVPQFGSGGFWGSPYPDFDYRLLYGLYPPGTYSTFSQQHEKGKDYTQDVHYLTEHGSDGGSDGSGQQRKIFQAAN